MNDGSWRPFTVNRNLSAKVAGVVRNVWLLIRSRLLERSRSPERIGFDAVDRVRIWRLKRAANVVRNDWCWIRVTRAPLVTWTGAGALNYSSVTVQTRCVA